MRWFVCPMEFILDQKEIQVKKEKKKKETQRKKTNAKKRNNTSGRKKEELSFLFFFRILAFFSKIDSLGYFITGTCPEPDPDEDPEMDLEAMTGRPSFSSSVLS